MDIKIINSDSPVRIYMIMAHRLLKRNFKVETCKRSNPATTRFSFWD